MKWTFVVTVELPVQPESRAEAMFLGGQLAGFIWQATATRIRREMPGFAAGLQVRHVTEVSPVTDVPPPTEGGAP